MTDERRIKRTTVGELAWKGLPLQPEERKILGLLKDNKSLKELFDLCGSSIDLLVSSMMRRGWIKFEENININKSLDDDDVIDAAASLNRLHLKHLENKEQEDNKNMDLQQKIHQSTIIKSDISENIEKNKLSANNILLASGIETTEDEYKKIDTANQIIPDTNKPTEQEISESLDKFLKMFGHR